MNAPARRTAPTMFAVERLDNFRGLDEGERISCVFGGVAVNRPALELGARERDGQHVRCSAAAVFRGSS